MPTQQSVILLEFNELCPSLMERFMQQGKLPNFQRLYEQSQVYTTDAEEQAPFLEPWIQWVTVHSGLSYREHQIFFLDEGHKLAAPSLWDRLSQAGYRVWICGSMNSRYDTPLNGQFLPDYWASRQLPYPDELAPFFNFVRRYVQEYTNDTVPLTLGDYWQFISFMMTHGLSGKTVRAIAQQLWKERITQRYRWQRATILDKLQWDVFRWYYRRDRPHFSTFFLNSTAHFQHMYWRNMEPGPFLVQPSPEEQREYENAILYGYQEMDQLVGECFELADSQTTIMLCTALSQQPCFSYEAIGGKHLYRPRRFEELLKFAGIAGAYDCSPVMAEEFFLRFSSEAAADFAQERLAALRVGEQPAMRLKRQGQEIYAGCGIFTAIAPDALLHLEGQQTSTAFFKLFYQIEDIKSGMHHPDGIFWICQPGKQPAVHADKLPLRSIAPMILDHLGVAPAIAEPVHPSV